jgi:hypothetical protein
MVCPARKSEMLIIWPTLVPKGRFDKSFCHQRMPCKSYQCLALTASRPAEPFRTCSKLQPGGDAVERCVRWQRWLLLAEKAPPDCLVHTRFWPNTIHVRYATPILRDQGEGPSPARLGFWLCSQEQLRYPVIKRVDHVVLAIVCRRVRVARNLPVVLRDQRVPQDAHVADRQG